MKKLIFTISLILTLTFVSSGQSTYYGAGVGQGLYWGDLNAPNFFTNLTSNNGFAFQAFVRHHYNPYFSFKANAMFSRVRGDDANSNLEWQQQRNLRFKSVVNELSASVEFYPLKFTPAGYESSWSPYVTFGVGGFYFNPTTELNGNEFELQPLGTEGQGMDGYGDKYNRVGASFLFGGGLAVKINKNLIIHADVIGRRSNTDYLDDVSQFYVNYDDLRSGNGILAATLADRTPEFFGSTEPIQRETGSQRGGESVRDYYFSGMISFSILLNEGKNSFKKNSKSSVKCPKF